MSLRIFCIFQSISESTWTFFAYFSENHPSSPNRPTSNTVQQWSPRFGFFGSFLASSLCVGSVNVAFDGQFKAVEETPALHNAAKPRIAKGCNQFSQSNAPTWRGTEILKRPTGSSFLAPFRHSMHTGPAEGRPTAAMSWRAEVPATWSRSCVAVAIRTTWGRPSVEGAACCRRICGVRQLPDGKRTDLNLREEVEQLRSGRVEWQVVWPRGNFAPLTETPELKRFRSVSLSWTTRASWGTQRQTRGWSVRESAGKVPLRAMGVGPEMLHWNMPLIDGPASVVKNFWEAGALLSCQAMACYQDGTVLGTSMEGREEEPRFEVSPSMEEDRLVRDRLQLQRSGIGERVQGGQAANLLAKQLSENLRIPIRHAGKLVWDASFRRWQWSWSIWFVVGWRDRKRKRQLACWSPQRSSVDVHQAVRLSSKKAKDDLPDVVNALLAPKAVRRSLRGKQHHCRVPPSLSFWHSNRRRLTWKFFWRIGQVPSVWIGRGDRWFDAEGSTLGVCASDPSWFARIAVYMQFAAVAVIAATCTLEAVGRFFCLQERMPILSYRLHPVLWHFWGVQCVGMGRNALKRSTPGRKKKSTKDLTSFKELSINMQRYTNPGLAWRCHHPQIHSTNAWLVVI